MMDKERELEEHYKEYGERAEEIEDD